LIPSRWVAGETETSWRQQSSERITRSSHI
jgi:hypothetical protein